jgi:hypothetical protein
MNGADDNAQAVAHMNVRALAGILADTQAIEALIRKRLGECDGRTPFVDWQGVERRLAGLTRAIDRAKRVQAVRARKFSTSKV